MSTTSSPTKQHPTFLLYAIFMSVSLAIYHFSAFPFPQELNGLGPKLEYYGQLALHLTGLKADWDIDALNTAYHRHFEATGQTLPNVSNRSTAYRLEPLFELDPAKDSSWKRKLQDRLSNGQPTVVRGLMYHDQRMFPMARKWNIDFFRDNVFPAGTQVPVFTNTMNDKSVVMQDFSEYVAGLQNKSRKWYARCLDDSKFVIRSGYDSEGLAELMLKKTEQSFTRKINYGQDYCVFVGSNQVSTRMHSDTTTSAFLMVQGRKRWVLFPSSQSPYVIPYGHEMNVAYNSRVDIFAPKDELLSKYPFISLAKGHEVILQAGDVLFFSSFTWHGVQNLDELTIGVDVGVVDGISSFGRNTPLTMGTYSNLKALVKVMRGYMEGGMGLKQAFFQGYNLDEKEAAKVKLANGL